MGRWKRANLSVAFRLGCNSEARLNLQLKMSRAPLQYYYIIFIICTCIFLSLSLSLFLSFSLSLFPLFFSFSTELKRHFDVKCNRNDDPSKTDGVAIVASRIGLQIFAVGMFELVE